jgi:hypothetical protein
MTHITLTSEQTAQLSGTTEDHIVLLDATGKRVGQIRREPSLVFSADRIAEAKQLLRTEAGGVTTAELLVKLQSLGEP